MDDGHKFEPLDFDALLRAFDAIEDKKEVESKGSEWASSLVEVEDK